VKTIKISEAKRNFGRIFARVKRGETIILQNGNDFMQLVPCAVPELVPIRPAGYFALDEEDAAFINACQPSPLMP
jgi:antitoxin (DNA-binding transcriptional repressor) of toxin-antitoxin stability system